MKTAGGEAALGGGSTGAPREKTVPWSSSCESGPHRDTKGVLETSHFCLKGFSWQRTAVETGGRWKSRGCVFSPPIHGDAASVGLTSGEEGTAVNRRSRGKEALLSKSGPKPGMKPPCAAFLQARAHSSGDARLLLFTFSFSFLPKLRPGSQHCRLFLSLLPVLPPPLSLWLHWARLAPCP